MFETIAFRITLENWRRVRFGVEVALAVVFLLAMVFYSPYYGGVNGILASLLMASVIVFHRIRPLLALGITAAVGVGLLAFGYGGGTPQGLLWLPVVFAVFGCAAYGRPVARWLALGVPVVVIVISAIGTYASYGYYNGVLSWAVNFGIMSLLYGGVALIPWVAGLLVRAQGDKLAAQNSQKVTAARLGTAVGETALAEERNRVAREVHDIVAHSLAVVIAQADGAQAIAGKAPAGVRDSLGVISATAREALADIRVLLTELRHSQDLTPQPGFAEIDSLVSGFEESGLKVVRTDFGTPVDASPATQLTIYRVLQEALTNALRHGANKPVDLEFEWTATDLEMTITNETVASRALDGEAIASGHGIAGMRERATLAGGRFAVHPGAAGRFRVRVGLPLERTLTAVG